MKRSVIAFSAASVLVISLIIIGTFKTGIVSALTATTTDATSTASDTMTASSSPTSASSTTPATDASSTFVTAAAAPQAPAQTQAQARPSIDENYFIYSKNLTNFGNYKMKLKLAIAFATAGFFFSIAGAEAITLSGSDGMPAIQSEAVKVQCAGGRRCVGGWGWRRHRRFCRRWVVCR